uniref:CX domain-containing protein n=1 Tax=Rhabditophanes sp. KR3021 TaxID=114890 RepID=A0AC35U2C4_9BILA
MNIIKSSFKIIFLLNQLLSICYGEICPSVALPNEKSLSTSLSINILIPPPPPTRDKRCPDFKDDPNQGACCPSQVTPGTYYCCSSDKKQEIESLIAANLRKQFIKNYLAAIIIISILSFLLFFLVISVICRRLKICPLYSKAHHHSYVTTHIATNYRPVVERIPSKPAVYEAPPPYDYSFSSGATVMSTTSNGSHAIGSIPNNLSHTQTYDENNWNYLLHD